MKSKIIILLVILLNSDFSQCMIRSLLIASSGAVVGFGFGAKGGMEAGQKKGYKEGLDIGRREGFVSGLRARNDIRRIKDFLERYKDQNNKK